MELCGSIYTQVSKIIYGSLLNFKLIYTLSPTISYVLLITHEAKGKNEKGNQYTHLMSCALNNLIY